MVQKRVWAFAQKHHAAVSGTSGAIGSGATLAEAHKALRREIHLGLRQADYDLKRIQYNTVVSATMKMLNALEGVLKGGNDAAANAVLREGLWILLRVLSPITQHITHQLWRDLGYGEDILNAAWPEPDAQALVESEMELVVQVNGKKRGDIRVPRDAGKDVIEAAALADAEVQKFVAGQAVKKVVIVPGRLVNIVV